MKKADIEKLIGTDHEIRVQSPNSTYAYDVAFGQVIAVNRYKAKSHYPHSTPQPIRESQGSQRGGVHVRVERKSWSDRIETVDEVVPYSHIHAETRPEYEARVAKEREVKDAHRREEDQIKQERRERAQDVKAAFQALDISVHDNHNGTVSMSLDDAERLLQRLGEDES